MYCVFESASQLTSRATWSLLFFLPTNRNGPRLPTQGGVGVSQLGIDLLTVLTVFLSFTFIFAGLSQEVPYSFRLLIHSLRSILVSKEILLTCSYMYENEP